ncbi:MAG: zinc-binding dehydrogenase, partial [Arthrobacter sp.]
VEVMDFPDPSPGPRDVVLRIDSSGICGSDLHTFRRPGSPGAYQSVDPRQTHAVIAGHEPVGTVVERGAMVSAAEAPIGLQSICFHYSGCGDCLFCRDERPQLCAHMLGYGGNAHGGHAEYLVVPVETLVPLPDGLSANAGACLACGTGTAYGALQRLRRIPEQNLLVVGLGPVGVSTVAYAAALGARVIAVDLDKARRESALTYGAETVLDPATGDITEQVRELTNGYGADSAVETSGSTPGRRSALGAVRQEGEAVFVGLGGGNLEVAMDIDVVLAPRSIIGSRTFSKSELAEAARVAAELKLPLDRMVSAEFPLHDAQRAYDEFAAGAVGKYVLVGAGA